MVCGPEVSGVTEEVKAVEDSNATTAVVATEAEEDEDATEFVNFSDPAPYSGGDLALDWGVASIGAGTLYPNQQYVATGGGGFFGGGGNNGGSDSFYPGVPNTVINNTIINYFYNTGGPGPGPDPVPEPATLGIWIVGGVATLAWLNRKRRLNKVRTA